MSDKITNPISIKRVRDRGLTVEQVEEMIETEGAEKTQSYLWEAWRNKGKNKDSSES